MQSNEAPVQPAQLVSRYYKLPFRKAKHLSGQQVGLMPSGHDKIYWFNLQWTRKLLNI